MTDKRPEVEPTKQYSVKRTCDILAISESTLRLYKRKGLIKSTNKVGHPKYKGSDILRLWSRKKPLLILTLPPKVSKTIMELANEIKNYYADQPECKAQVNEVIKTLYDAMFKYERMNLTRQKESTE